METHNKLTTIALAAFAIAAAFVALAVFDGSSEPIAASPAIDPPEAEFMQILNDYRAQNGLGPILIDSSLQAAAEWMSTDMGVNNYFSHTDSTGGSPWDRMCDHGYCYNTWKGENIAAGYSSPSAVFEGWKNSPGHNANMLGENYVVMGIALVHTPGSTYGYYWTNDFGGHNPDPNPSPPPAPTNSPTPTTSPTQAPTSPATASPTATPKPTATPTPTSTATPAPSAPKTPTPTPDNTTTPVGDIDCDNVITTSDVLALLRYLGGVSHDLSGTCPSVGQNAAGGHIEAQGTPAIHGDVDCNGAVDGRDAVAVLRLAGSGDQSVSCP